MSKHRYDPAATVRAYIMVFACLMGFTALTVAAAFVDLGSMNNVVAMTIAVAKALLVAMIFMHLKGGSPLNLLWISSGIFGFLIMIAFPLLDLLSRNILGIPGK